MIANESELFRELDSRELREHKHVNVELKQNWKQDVGKDISGLCNKATTTRSWVLVGINDVGTVVGQDEAWAKATEQQISSHINHYLDPFQACEHVEARQLHGRWFIIVRVKNPGSVVYWNSKAYKLTGTVSEEMEPDETLALTLSLPGLNDFSSQDCNVGQLDLSAVQQLAARAARFNATGIFADLHAINPDAALHRLGIRGKQVTKILFGDSSSFRLICYDSAGHPVKNQRIHPLYRIFDPALKTEIDAFTLGRPVQPNDDVYPIAAYQEAIANAVAHAAYFQADGEVMIEVFPNRLCVSNLCARESAYFANRWFSRSHFTLNKLLMETLRIAHHVDELGRGKNLIFGDYIASGREAPSVAIERAGRYSRWRLTLPGSATNERHLRLLERLRAHYAQDEQKARIALALVLWRTKPVEEIRKHVDGEFAPLFAQVLSDSDGATFYFKEKDSIVLNRWTRLLIHEGVNSKSLNEEEEQHLFRMINEICGKLQNGRITPKDIREFAELGNGHGAESHSSRILQKWAREGRIEKVKRGVYKLKILDSQQATYTELLELFTKK